MPRSVSKVLAVVFTFVGVSFWSASAGACPLVEVGKRVYSTPNGQARLLRLHKAEVRGSAALLREAPCDNLTPFRTGGSEGRDPVVMEAHLRQLCRDPRVTVQGNRVTLPGALLKSGDDDSVVCGGTPASTARITFELKEDVLTVSYKGGIAFEASAQRRRETALVDYKADFHLPPVATPGTGTPSVTERAEPEEDPYERGMCLADDSSETYGEGVCLQLEDGTPVHLEGHHAIIAE